MENVSNVYMLRLSVWSAADSVEHCVPIVFRLGIVDNVWVTVDCAGIVFDIDFNDDRLLTSSSMDAFCDNAENLKNKCIKIDSVFKNILW